MNQNNYPVYYQTPTQQYAMGQQRQQQPAYILKGRPVSSLILTAVYHFSPILLMKKSIPNRSIWTVRLV